MRRAIITSIVAILSGTAMLPSAPPAAAGGSFTFDGSGYGHGLGMSQWGAYGLAKMGWTHGRILRHFYQGTKVERAPEVPDRIRVGLTTGRTVVHLGAQGGPVRIWEGKAGRRLAGKIPGGATWTVTAKADGFAIRDGAGRLVGERRWGGPAVSLTVTYERDGARVFIPEADSIWYDGFAYARGSIEIDLYDCTSGCRERLIARVSMQDYLYGLGEVPASWPRASLRAQAVAARSYATYAIVRYGLRSDCACHLTDGSGDQTYIGYDRESGSMGDRWLAAVDATAGQAVTFGGRVIQAFYAASDGGHSENVEDVWHAGNDAFAIPWLRGVCDPGESTSANPWTAWERTFDAASVTSRLGPYTGPIGTVSAFDRITRGSSGRIVTLRVLGTGGSRTITGTQLRAGLGLPDDRVWINADRTISGPIRERYDQLMCAPGLPSSPTTQVPGGVQQLFTGGGLYRNGSKGFTVWIKGAIDDEYRAVGTGSGVLGVPTTKVRDLSRARAVSCTNCKVLDFVGGRIYWKGVTGAHALWGPVLRAYLDEGGAGGWLGFPLTRVLERADGGVRARFEHGAIRCATPKTCVAVAD
ncbi:MAG: SpoIID/LytB domain-containing protein [Actinomycetota bacterium]